MNTIITIEDIAKAAGVGKGTVDRVIHNRGRVSEDTRKKVQYYIDKLGYKPNMAARMLAKRKVYKITVIFRDEEAGFWGEVKKGIARAEAEFGQMGVEIDPVYVRGSSAEEQIKAQVNAIRAAIRSQRDGIAIVPFSADEVKNAMEEAADAGVPIVVFNNEERCHGSIYVGDNNLLSGRTAGRLAALMAGENARLLVVVPVVKFMKSLDQRYEGFRETVEQLRPDLTVAEVLDISGDYQKAYREILRKLSEEKIDLIYATNMVVENVAAAVEEAGKQDEVKVIGHDLTDAVREALRKGTIDAAIGQEPERQGYLAVSKLCNMLLKEEPQEDTYTRIGIAVAENEWCCD